MADRTFKYTTLRAPAGRIGDLDLSRVRSAAPTAVRIECESCGEVWDYHVQKEGLGYAPVTCPGCGTTEAYAGHVCR